MKTTSEKFQHATMIPGYLYDQFKRGGEDMRHFLRQGLMPTSGCTVYTMVHPYAERKVVDWLGREQRSIPQA